MFFYGLADSESFMFKCKFVYFLFIQETDLKAKLHNLQKDIIIMCQKQVKISVNTFLGF